MPWNFARIILPAVLHVTHIYMCIWMAYLHRAQNSESGYNDSSICMKIWMSFGFLTKWIIELSSVHREIGFDFCKLVYDINLNSVRMTSKWLCINPIGISEDNFPIYAVYPVLDSLFIKVNLHCSSEAKY